MSKQCKKINHYQMQIHNRSLFNLINILMKHLNNNLCVLIIKKILGKEKEAVLINKNVQTQEIKIIIIFKAL